MSTVLLIVALLVAPNQTGPGALQRLAAQVDCKPGSTDPLRAWCAAASTAGAGFTAPKGPVTYLGLSAPLAASVDVRAALLKANISALSFSDGKVQIVDIGPENDQEKAQLAKVAANLGAALTGQANEIKVAQDLSGFLATLAPAAAAEGHAIKDDPQGAKFQLKGSARAWRVKTQDVEALVFAEDVKDRTFVSVYPLLPYVAR